MKGMNDIKIKYICNDKKKMPHPHSLFSSSSSDLAFFLGSPSESSLITARLLFLEKRKKEKKKKRINVIFKTIRLILKIHI